MTDHEKDLQRIKNFCLMDDDFFAACLAEHIECTELILHTILGRTDLQVTETHAQYFIKNLQGRSVRLDILAKDAAGRQYNIEMQRANEGANPRRARYNSSIMDANITNPGDKYDQLPETYVIFITAEDVLKRNRPIYDIQRVIMEENIPFNDGSHILYVNAEYQDHTPLGQLMSDLHCTDPNQMYYPALAKRTKYFKEDSEGVSKMCKAMEDMRNEAVKSNNLEKVFRLLKLGKLSYAEIAEVCDLSVSEVEVLAKNQQNQ